MEPIIPIAIVLYAETHFRPIPGLCRLFRREPEILTDLPWRLEPGNELPLLCLVKDADRFPVRLEAIGLTIHDRSGKVLFRHEERLGETVRDRLWWRVFGLSVPDDIKGDTWVRVRVRITLRGRSREVIGHNYRAPLSRLHRVHFAADPLPRRPGWRLGDIHHHSFYTDDLAEFGAPVPAAARAARAMGLDWLAVTDHSYDLDDRDGDPSSRDPETGKWRSFRDEVELLNRKSDGFKIIPGEEVSAGTVRGRNVHLLVLGHPEFIAGEGDSAERPGRNRPTQTIAEVLDRLSEGGGIGIAAHPLAPAPWLERLILRRGRWTEADLAHEDLTGVQLLNGRPDGKGDGGFAKGLDCWVRLLLTGKDPVLVAGSDSHGNFNRLRQLAFPCLKMRESSDQVLGACWTGVQAADGPGEGRLIEAIRRGRTYVSTGPFVSLTARPAGGGEEGAPGAVCGDRIELTAAAVSSPEFGRLDRVEVRWGGLMTGGEVELNGLKTISTGDCERELKGIFRPPCRGYVRAIVRTVGPERIALTNPVRLAPF